MGKSPASQFYWGDWLNDVELQSACAASRGIWANALARMWYSKVRGEIVGTREKLPQILNCTQEEFDVFLHEAETLFFCYASRNDNGTITLRNRRMYREEKERESNRLRQEKHRKKNKNNAHDNGEITPPSSTSSSTSYLNNKESINIILLSGASFEVTPEMILSYHDTYPNIDIILELKKCRQWNNDNPKKRKTDRGILKHINSWLSRASEGRNNGNGTGSGTGQAGGKTQVAQSDGQEYPIDAEF